MGFSPHVVHSMGKPPRQIAPLTRKRDDPTPCPHVPEASSDTLLNGSAQSWVRDVEAAIRHHPQGDILRRKGKFRFPQAGEDEAIYLTVEGGVAGRHRFGADLLQIHVGIE